MEIRDEMEADTGGIAECLTQQACSLGPAPQAFLLSRPLATCPGVGNTVPSGLEPLTLIIGQENALDICLQLDVCVFPIDISLPRKLQLMSS